MESAGSRRRSGPGAVREVLLLCALPLASALTLFLAAGRVDLPFLWAPVAAYAAAVAFNNWTMDPDLRRERLRPPPGGRGAGALPVVLRTVLLSSWLVAGLDVGRFHWSDSVPVALRVGALLLYAGAVALQFWINRVNRFFSTVVRVQAERGHSVIDTGPYGYIRHPGYLVGIASMLGLAMAPGSWCAVAIASLTIPVYIHRILSEERFLMAELSGYREYTERVRYRLISHVW